jgi:hypothetical protein
MTIKRFATKTLFITAARAALAIGAWAQSMSAEIPFTFRAGDTVLRAGSYRITMGDGYGSVIRLTKAETHKSVMLVPRYRSDASKSRAADNPKLWFACTGSNCVLARLWNGRVPPCW